MGETSCKDVMDAEHRRMGEKLSAWVVGIQWELKRARIVEVRLRAHGCPERAELML
jgi:hypothetical protein